MKGTTFLACAILVGAGVAFVLATGGNQAPSVQQAIPPGTQPHQYQGQFAPGQVPGFGRNPLYAQTHPQGGSNVLDPYAVSPHPFHIAPKVEPQRLTLADTAPMPLTEQPNGPVQVALRPEAPSVIRDSLQGLAKASPNTGSMSTLLLGQPRPALEPPRIFGPYQADPSGGSLTSPPSADFLSPTNQKTAWVIVRYGSDTENGKDTLRFLAGSQILKVVTATLDANRNQVVKLDLSNLANRFPLEQVIRTQLEDADGILTSVFSQDVFSVAVDTIGPRLASAELIGVPGGVSTLRVLFEEADLKLNTVLASSFIIQRLTPSGVSEEVGGVTLVSKSPNEVRLLVPNLTTGTYTVTLSNSPDAKNVLTDHAENPPGITAEANIIPQTRQFTSFPRAEQGKHVEFPPFLPPRVDNPDEDFNPGANVATRVVRLFYMRDAHRVAQIVNRTVKSYNLPAVDQKQRIAQDFREEARDARDERKRNERAAIRAAEGTRAAEAELAAAEQNLEIARTALARTIQQQFANQGTENEIDEAKVNQVNEIVTDARNKVFALQQKVASFRENERNLDELTHVAELKEDRAVEKQFLAEVDARKSDPDTFAPGKTNSIDPVAQVSISVIGEGRLQLRGPIRGINRIRTMINQMDSPLGQVRVNIHTVQINGEKPKELENAASKIEGHVDLTRFQTSQSLLLLRRAVVEVASEVAVQVERECRGNRQLDRDRRYLYGFFGRDFIDELYAMDSEFLKTGNKLFSLHSMDTISLNRSLFITSLAKNDIREAILQRFIHLVHNYLPEAEYDFRKTNFLIQRPMEHLYQVARERYNFRSLLGHFNETLVGTDTMNPTQREFIRMAQIFKSRLVSELELKQRIVERGLIQDANRSDKIRQEQLQAFRNQLVSQEPQAIQDVFNAIAQADDSFQTLLGELRSTRSTLDEVAEIVEALNNTTFSEFMQRLTTNRLPKLFDPSFGELLDRAIQVERVGVAKSGQKTQVLQGLIDLQQTITDASFEGSRILRAGQASLTITRTRNTNPELFLKVPLGKPGLKIFFTISGTVQQVIENGIPKYRFSPTPRPGFPTGMGFLSEGTKKPEDILERTRHLLDRLNLLVNMPPNSVLRKLWDQADKELKELTRDFNTLRSTNDPMDALRVFAGNQSNIENLRTAMGKFNAELIRKANPLTTLLQTMKTAPTKTEDDWRVRVQASDRVLLMVRDLFRIERPIESARVAKDASEKAYQAKQRQRLLAALLEETQAPLNHKKLLDFLIDEQTEKYIDLVEATRAHIAIIDNHLKRLSIALEDDCKVQFVDPAFQNIRAAAQECAVTFGQVERTSVLTNNRELAKVHPEATMEFDLPKRDIMITEAMNGARAIMQEYGSLLEDPTFLSLTDMLSGSPSAGGLGVQNVLPGLDSPNLEKFAAQQGGPRRQFGSALESLIPDPAVYKFETGTAFEIRPVIQPGGDAIVYDFNYMYTTNVREPVRPDEKHLGRVKRHFINTQVQTSSFELREVSRYQVALKAARTSRGVPLFEDLPGVGVLFRPLPSAGASLQQNIILAQSTVYPTLFDLMGLRWAPAAIDLDHVPLRDEEHVVRGRQQTIKNFVFEESSSRVDAFLDIAKKYPQHSRPGLYHRQTRPSPYHPGGYVEPNVDEDPTREKYLRVDQRPEEYRQPAYDELHRREVIPEFVEAPPEVSPTEEKVYAPGTYPSGTYLPESYVPPEPASQPSIPVYPPAPPADVLPPHENRGPVAPSKPIPHLNGAFIPGLIQPNAPDDISENSPTLIAPATNGGSGTHPASLSLSTLPGNSGPELAGPETTTTEPGLRPVSNVDQLLTPPATGVQQMSYERPIQRRTIVRPAPATPAVEPVPPKKKSFWGKVGEKLRFKRKAK